MTCSASTGWCRRDNGDRDRYAQAEEFQPGYRLARWRANPTADGVIVELEARYGEGPDQRMAREMHHLVRGPEGVTEHVLFCTGVWPPATVAIQAAQAPMVRW